MKKILYIEKEKNLIKAELKYIIKYKGIEYYSNRCFTCKKEDLNKALVLFAKSIKNVIFKDAKTFYTYEKAQKLFILTKLKYETF